MVSDIDFYRIVRYLAILTYEHYMLLDRFNEKFGVASPPIMSLEEILKNVCKDFGLPYDAVLANSRLENWGKK